VSFNFIFLLHIAEIIGIISASAWLFKKKSIMMHGNMTVRFKRKWQYCQCSVSCDIIKPWWQYGRI